ncbi:MAG: hypothetical protein C0601_04100 [Candidatus Muiribacterium halophilum]|uniref:Uncharacterized protein n=1 Tax=Muiribacterium halophilum TaxID=2053465 RepID=A0A2N5ZJ19_MUIH1|nr:MAG: hypothetical protein C0601_04100 [Candidatus Muirbacterium halophilum]
MKKLSIFLLVFVFILASAYTSFGSEWYNKGYSLGLKEGRASARVEGFKNGKNDGQRKGTEEGRKKGYREGRRRGEEQGHEAGMAKGIRNGRYEGEKDGKDKGTRDGRDRCYDEGYRNGKATGNADGNEAGINSDAYDKGYLEGVEKAEKIEYQKGYQAGYTKTYSETEKKIREKVLADNSGSLRFRNNPGVFELDNVRTGTSETKITPEQQAEFDKGKQEGFKKGYAEKYHDYYKSAYDKEYREAYEKARKTAYDRGFREGFEAGKDEGYRDGYRQGYDEAYDKTYREYYNREYSYDRERGYNEAYDKYYKQSYDNAYDMKYREGYDKGYSYQAAITYPDAFKDGQKAGRQECIAYFRENALPELVRVNIRPENEEGIFEAGGSIYIEALVINYGEKTALNAGINPMVASGDVKTQRIMIPEISGQKTIKVVEKCGRVDDNAKMNSKALLNVGIIYNGKMWNQKTVMIKLTNFDSPNYRTLTKAAGLIEEAITRLDDQESSYKNRLNSIKELIIAVCEYENLDNSSKAVKDANDIGNRLDNLFEKAPFNVRFALKSAQRLLERNVIVHNLK